MPPEIDASMASSYKTNIKRLQQIWVTLASGKKMNFIKLQTCGKWTRACTFVGALGVAFVVIIIIQLLSSDQSKPTHTKGRTYGSRVHTTGKLPPHMDQSLCDINCTTGVPCEYKDELDFRIIVITYKRVESLRKCLRHVAELDTLGDRVGVDIWVDRSKEGDIDPETLEVAHDFRDTWDRGRACVHLQQRNAFIMGQWVDTWRPRVGTREMALILEDDIDLSPLAYKWLKHVNEHFYNWPDIAGYTLQMENVKFVKGKYVTATGPKTDSVFLHYLPNTWGFAPFPKHWRTFQDWFHEKRMDTSFQPLMPGIIPNDWFVSLMKEGRQDSMWEMWDIYYFYHQNLFTVCSNLLQYTDRRDVLLDKNREEAGLHYSGRSRIAQLILNTVQTLISFVYTPRSLMTEWDPSYVKFPVQVTRYDMSGDPIQ